MLKLFGKKNAVSEVRSFDENSVDNKLRKALGIDNCKSITFKQAMQIPAVCASVNFISEICARVPVKLYKEGLDGTTQEVRKDKRTTLLNDNTGDLLNAFQMKKAWVTDYFDGRGYIYINRYGNSFESLNYVSKKDISIMKNTHPIFKSADIFIAEKRYYPFEFLRLCRDTKDGVTGTSIVETNGELLGLYFDTIRYEKLLMNTGGNRKGFLKSPKKLGDDALTEIRYRWNNFFNKKHDNMMILNDGIDFMETSATSTEMQLNENKTTNANDITMMFLLSAKALQGGSDDEIVAAVKTAVIPIICQMEAAYNDSLLLEDEKDSMYFSCDTSQIERGDILKRFRAYQIALQSNFMQPDEVRYNEDLSPLGLDFIKLGLNDVLYNPKTKEVYTPNTNQKAKIDGNSGQIEDRKFISDGNPKIYAVDFDGTLCIDNQPNTELIEFLKAEQKAGGQVILWTCREGESLDKAVHFCQKFGLEFNAVNENVPQIIERFGSNSRKIYADVYIDDKMLSGFEDRKKSNFIQGKDGKTQGSYSTGGGGSALTKGGGSGKIKTDFNGVPYTYPELKLPKKEYGKVIREIDDLYYSKYDGKEKAKHRSGKNVYCFEIRGYNDYNIYTKYTD